MNREIGPSPGISLPPTPSPVRAPRRERRSSPRAPSLPDACIGALLAAGNVYTGLKTGYIDGGSITAAVVAFALLGTARAGGKRPYSIAENNLTQTIASSAAVMSIVTGVIGPVGCARLERPRLPVLGHRPLGNRAGRRGGGHRAIARGSASSRSKISLSPPGGLPAR